MAEIAIFVFNPFQENTYVVLDDTGECIIIDAGNYSALEDKKLSEYIERKGLKPVMAVNTHGHVDHMLGVQYVKDTYGVPFALHGDDRFLIESCREHGKLYGFQVDEIPQVDTDLKDMAEVKFGDTVLQVIHTPGHSPGHICLYDKRGKTLFSGDTLFKESIGRTDLPGGDYSWIMKSILNKILPLGGDVTFYPGHGPHSTLGHEVLYNPFIAEVLNNEVSYE